MVSTPVPITGASDPPGNQRYFPLGGAHLSCRLPALPFYLPTRGSLCFCYPIYPCVVWWGDWGVSLRRKLPHATTLGCDDTSLRAHVKKMAEYMWTPKKSGVWKMTWECRIAYSAVGRGLAESTHGK